MNYLPQFWKDKLYKHTTLCVKNDKAIFEGSVTILFEDSSIVKFENAFVMTGRSNDVAVFTKNCGYHIFESTDITTIV